MSLGILILFLFLNVPISDIWFNETEHLLRRLRHLHEHTVVNLEQPEQLEDLARLGCDFVDTTDTDDEVDLRLGGDVEVACGACCALQADFLTFLCGVLLHVGLGALEDDFALCASGL